MREEELPQPCDEGTSERTKRGGKQDVQQVYCPLLMAVINSFEPWFDGKVEGSNEWKK